MTTEDSGLQEAAADNFLPCPFCGGEPEPLTHEISPGYNCHLQCANCKAYGPRSEYREGAAPAWNKRTPSVPDVPTALDAGGVAVNQDLRNDHAHIHELELDNGFTCKCGYSLSPKSPSPAAATGEWTSEQVAGGSNLILGDNGQAYFLARPAQAKIFKDAHNAALAQLTARAEAAEAKLKKLKVLVELLPDKEQHLQIPHGELSRDDCAFCKAFEALEEKEA